jgi:antitoxin YefM
MMNTTATSFRKNLFSLLDQAIKFNEPINISTKNGNAIILSADDYNELVETLKVSSNSVMREKILDGLNTAVTDCVPENEVVW